MIFLRDVEEYSELYISLKEVPLGVLPSRDIEGITIRRVHLEEMQLVRLMPDAGIARHPVTSPFFYLELCYTCDCAWGKDVLDACWNCGEERHLPPPRRLEKYAGI